METMQIDKICRACLREDAEMIDTPFDTDVYQKFHLFANLTVEEELRNIPFNLCRSCEQKLNVQSLIFKAECQSSHELLLNRVRNCREVKLEATDVDGKKLLKLEQFPEEDVSAAIDELKQRFYKNTHCIRCNYVGKQSRALSQHMSLMHKKLKSRWCCECNGEFDDLIDHIATNHSDEYICKFCTKRYRIRSKLTEHLQHHCDKYRVTYKCSLCDKSFTRLNRLKIHWKSHKIEGDSEKESFVAVHNFCVECNRNVRNLVAHNEQIHSPVNDDHSCTVCKKNFKTVSKLRQHMQMHSNKPHHRCKYCNKNFSTRTKLILHKRTHTGEKPYACQVCGRSFAVKDSLNGHMYLHNIGTKISCKTCGKTFCRPHHLHLHLRNHTGERPFVCTDCGKTFMQQSHLNVHVKIHRNIRPYQCNCCDKSFINNYELKRHMWMHSGEKPYKCSQCSYACRHTASLSKHMKQHVADTPRAEKPHACLMCNGTFSTQAMLTSHIKTHTVSFLDVQS